MTDSTQPIYPIDLAPEHKNRLLKVMAEHMPDVEILVYGSRINWRGHDGSDLDIALRTYDLKPIDADRLERLMQAIQSINLPFLVDVHDWLSLPDSFKVEVLKHFILLD